MAVSVIAASSAQAKPESAVSAARTSAVQSWSVPEKRLSGLLFGACYARSDATYDTATRTLDVTSVARSTSPYGGCRARAVWTMTVAWQGAQYSSKVYSDIPTACGTFDTNCQVNPPPGTPGRGVGIGKWGPWSPADDVTFISFTDYKVELR